MNVLLSLGMTMARTIYEPCDVDSEAVFERATLQVMAWKANR
jgi:hypothetical protein